MFQQKAANCLNLVGDGDDVDVLVSVERAFAVKISDDEAKNCETVGDLFDLVVSKLPPSHSQLAGCPTALAFFRLRAALRRLGYTQRVTPLTDLRPMFHAEGARHFHFILSREVGFALPALQFSVASIAILAFILLAAIAFAFLMGSWLSLLSGVALMMGVGRLLPKTIPRDVAMLGDCAVHCAIWNYGMLSKQSGVRLRDFWNTLTTVVRESSGTDFAGIMQRDTRFFPERKTASQSRN